MKKFLLLSLALVVSNVLFAQLPKGLPIVAGNTDLSAIFTSTQVKYDGEEMGDAVKSTKFNFSPIFAYTVAENVAVGLAFKYQTEKVEDGDAVTDMLVGPIARYYIPAGGKVFPFVHGQAIIGSSNEAFAEMYPSGDHGAKLFNWGLALGVDVPVNPKAFLDFSVGYEKTTATSKEDDKLQLGMSDLAIKVGFMVVIGK